MLEQLLLPQRLTSRLLDDLHRAAEAVVALGALAGDLRGQIMPIHDWMQTTAAVAGSLRDEVAGVRTSVEPVPGEMDALRREFGGSNDEIERLREAFVPELAAIRRAAEGLHGDVGRACELLVAIESDIRDMGQRLTNEMNGLNEKVRRLSEDADEMRDVVEPLQTATERVGRVAERLPGPGRKR